MQTLTDSEHPRILIVRLSAIGDTIHSLPLAAALRRNFPNAFLGWVVEKPAAALIENNPLLDWVRVVPKGWLKRPRDVLALRRELRRARFDLAFDVQGLSKSAVAAWLSGAPTRIGFTRGEAREIAPLLDTMSIAPSGRHAIDKTLSLLSGIGLAPVTKAEFAFPECHPGDVAVIDQFCSGSTPAPGFVLMGPWGSFPAKLWPLERFGELALRLHARTGMISAVLGHGEKERGAVADLAARHQGIVKPAPDVGLTGVVELARRASLFVGCDSFPMHAAAAVGCPTLGLFGVTDPQRLGPYGPLGRSVYATLTLPSSTRERRALGPENMLALDVDAVLEASLDLARQ